MKSPKKKTAMIVKFLVAVIPVIAEIAASLVKVSFEILKDVSDNFSKKL